MTLLFPLPFISLLFFLLFVFLSRSLLSSPPPLLLSAPSSRPYPLPFPPPSSASPGSPFPPSAGAAPERTSALFAFGVIADIQYADREDGTNFKQTSTRRYRHALEITRRAVEDWTTQSRTGGVPGWGARTDLAFIAQMGDIIDGCNKGLGASDVALQTVLAELDKAPSDRFVHLIGNHEVKARIAQSTRPPRHSAPCFP